MTTAASLVHPTKLRFHVHEEETHKQILTISNPFDLTLTYKILSTAPAIFIVRPAKGKIKSNSNVDVVVTLTEIPENESQVDKFMIQLTNESDTVVAKKVVVVNYGFEADRSSPNVRRRSSAAARSRQKSSTTASPRSNSKIFPLLFFLLCCIIVFFPSSRQPSSHSPSPSTQSSQQLRKPDESDVYLEQIWDIVEWFVGHFRFSSTQQLFAAFLLGMGVMGYLNGM
ncbi:PapD-like protein [Paraphysoderma sedebokerense]|nr:PapD-like protein [Paraphysoderma sedebokerense]